MAIAAEGQGPWVVEGHGLRKVYQLSRTNRYEALRGVDLCIARGERAAIIGPSGSGKTTLLNLLGTLDRPSEGTLAIDGVDTSRLGDNDLARLRAERLGFVFQNFSLVPRMSAADNVALALVPLGVAPGERKARAMAALEQVGLADRAANRPAELSGGEQQRVAIARALVNEPALLLADEPTGNLDTLTGKAVLDLIRDANARTGVTVVVVTHDMALAGQMDRVIRIRDGLVEGDGPPPAASAAGVTA